MADFTCKDVSIAAKKLINVRECLVSHLKEYLSELEKESTKNKTIKTVSAGASILGTLALFTPAAPIGITLLVSGAGGSVVTSIIDVAVARRIQSHLQELLKEERPYADKLEDMLMRLKEYTSEVAIYHSMDYNTAAKLVVGKFALGGFKGIVCMTKRGSIPTAKAAGKVISKIVTSPRLAGTAAVKILAKPGAQTAGKIFKNVLGPISVGLDVADIIYTWNSAAPGVKDVKEVIGKLESGIEDVKEVKNILLAAQAQQDFTKRCVIFVMLVLLMVAVLFRILKLESY